MKRAHGNRVWRGLVLAAAIGAVAVLALSGLAAARDHGGSGHRHGADTGTIASFDPSTDMLAIKLSGEGGATISGLVTPHTKIRCEDEHAPDVSSRAFKRDSGSNSGPGHGSADNSGRETEPGDDNGGHGNEPGDDHGNQGTEPGDDNGNQGAPQSGGNGPSGHDDNGDGANCTTSDLTVGATVHDATLDLRDGQAVWDEVELP
jgi:hypothetical protein